jgi:hypothetical protein
MGLLSSLTGVLARAVIALPGDSTRGLARGDSGKIGYAIVCRHCQRLLGANVYRPRSILSDCVCGRTTGGNWRTSTIVLPGRSCANCGWHLFYRSGQVGQVVCDGRGRHDPSPVHAVDLRDR